MPANSGDVTDIVLDLESEKKNLKSKKGNADVYISPDALAIKANPFFDSFF